MRAASPVYGASASCVGRGRSEADRDSGAPAGQVSNRLSRKTRERSLGEGSGKAPDDQPWKGETQGSIQRSAD
jgi:hypothetical protein